MNPPDSYRSDVEFLCRHVEVVELTDLSGDAWVAVVPAWQGRVATSACGGRDSPGHGWLNRPVIEWGIRPPTERKGKLEEKIHVFGGEERFWLGPEGSRFSIYFDPGRPMTFEHWRVPAPLDTEPFEVVHRSRGEVRLRREFAVTNWSGAVRRCRVERTVRVLPFAAMPDEWRSAVPPGSLCMAAYETQNVLINASSSAWTPETGLLSIWILGMFKPSPCAVIVIPIRAGEDGELGPKVNDLYFGRPPPERLRVTDAYVFFRADGRMRGKIGVSPRRSRGLAAAWSPDAGLLTIVQCPDVVAGGRYVNSLWDPDVAPYDGDAINAYNDGPPAPDRPPLGPFFELETSSPGAELGPGGRIVHVSRTWHVRGDRSGLDALARAALGIGLGDIEGALPAPP